MLAGVLCACGDDDAATTKQDGGADAAARDGAAADSATPGSGDDEDAGAAGGALDAVERHGSVKLPSGLDVKPTALTVQSTAGKAKLGASGDFKLTTFESGAQLAIVLSPKGNPMLLAWIDAEHHAIDAHTTAEVLLYFASGMPMLPQKVQAQAAFAFADFDGAAEVAKTIGAELKANVEAFGKHDAKLETAVDSALSSLSAYQGEALIKIEPGEQSGVMLNQDGPAAFHATNTLRRRGYMFVERLTPDPMKMGDFEVPPTIGLNGGVFGAATDIINAYYGNQATAYGPVDAPDKPFGIPVVNDEKTTYQVTLVGPAPTAGVESELDEAQKAALLEVSMRGFLKDALVPFLVNIVLGSGVIDFGAGQQTDQGALIANLVNSLVTDLTNLAPQVPGIADQIRMGAWKDAMLVLWTNAAASNTLRTALDEALKAYAEKLYPGEYADKFGNISTGFSKFNAAINAAGGLTQAFDSLVYARALHDSDRANQWTIDVLPSKIKLNPASSMIGEDEMVELEVKVLDADDVTGYTYHWKNTGKYGSLHEPSGPMRTSNDYCSSTPRATYVQSGTPKNDSDTITVEVFPRSRCEGDALGTATATVEVDEVPSLLNGDFSEGLDHWTPTTLGGNGPMPAMSISYGCFPEQEGNPYAILDIYGGDAYIEQTFKVPASAKTLSLHTWNNLDPATATISILVKGAETVLEAFQPPSVQKLNNPDDLYDVGCTGNSPASVSYPLDDYAGKTVTLRLRGTWIGGVNGTFVSYDDVKVE
jgi:hypothetical protein